MKYIDIYLKYHFFLKPSASKWLVLIEKKGELFHLNGWYKELTFQWNSWSWQCIDQSQILLTLVNFIFKQSRHHSPCCSLCQGYLKLSLAQSKVNEKAQKHILYYMWSLDIGAIQLWMKKPGKCFRLHSALNERLSIASISFFVRGPCLALDVKTNTAPISPVGKH